MEAQRREAAAVDGARPEIRFRMRAVDGATAPPEAACRVGAVVVFGGAVGGHRRRCEEGARLGEGDAERACAGGDADEVEEVAVLAGRGVGPLAGNARRREPDEERAPPRAASVTGGPVPALPAAVGQVAPADVLGACGERGGDGGGRAHDADLGSEGGPAKPEP